MFMLAPRLLPSIIRLVKLVWRLTFDKRVSIFLRALVPLAVVYAFSPLDLLPDMKVPFGIGRFDDLIILSVAVLLLTKLAPQHVIDEHLGKPRVARPEDKDPDKVVDGSSHLIDDK
ncbi:MAG: hypothetical protein BZY88_01995 [SAR202 cluster bacterium Io17-Chloro-G9]|nr:MAG: hypothetical protein BZY88_01995 [SAR202 cluster bacterium Io17-Chloro-G9]